MPRPGRPSGNRARRFTPEPLTCPVSQRLLDSTLVFGRDPKLYEGKDPESGGQSGQGVKGAGG